MYIIEFDSWDRFGWILQPLETYMPYGTFLRVDRSSVWTQEIIGKNTYKLHVLLRSIFWSWLDRFPNFKKCTVRHVCFLELEIQWIVSIWIVRKNASNLYVLSRLTLEIDLVGFSNSKKCRETYISIGQRKDRMESEE